MTILGIDPGLAATGICVLRNHTVIYRGTVKTGKELSDEERCRRISSAIGIVHLTYEPDSTWVEDYSYHGPISQNANSMRIPRLIGWIAGSLEATGCTVHLVERNTWGRAVAPSDQALKELCSSFKGDKLKNAHERDAGGIAHYAKAFWFLTIA